MYQGNFVDISLENDYNDDNYQGKVQLATLNPFRYRSYYFDEETGLYYLNSRYYDAELGRFINADSLDNLDKENFNGLNLFAYCLNNPINLTDSKGTSWWSDLWDRIKRNWDVIVGTIVSIVLVTAGVAITVLSEGTLAALGGTLIGAGVGGFINGLNSKLNGGNYWAGWLGGIVSGGLAGLGSAFGLVGAFLGGVFGNLAGTLITDSLNGDFVNTSQYWTNLALDSILSGLISIVGYQFSDASEILIKIGFSNIFAGMTVWSEFAFNYLTSAIGSILKEISKALRTTFGFKN